MSALEGNSVYAGVVFAGAAGVGKTSLARAVAGELIAAGAHVQVVVGTVTSQPIPLGALGHLVNLEGALDPAVMLATAHRQLAADPSLVLVVDDAHLLDPLSATLIHQLALGRRTRLVVTVRLPEPMLDAVVALWKDEHLFWVEVEALTRSQTAELLGVVLDGPVDEGLVAQLWEISAGNALLLHSSIMAGIERETIGRVRGVWCMRGQMGVRADMVDLFTARLRHLPGPAREVIEIVAVAEQLDCDVLRQTCLPAAIEDVEQRGLIRILVEGPNPVARLFHPVLGEVIRSAMGLVRQRQLSGRIAQATIITENRSRATAAGPSPDARSAVRLAVLITQSDLDMPDLTAVVDAAASAITMSSVGLGEQLARYVFNRSGDFSASLVLAEALSWQGRGDEAESLLNRFDPGMLDELGAVRWGCTRAANLFWACAQPDTAERVLRTVRQRVFSLPVLDLVVAMETAFAYFGGDIPRAIQLGHGLDTDSVSMPLAVVWSASATAGALAACGRFEDASSVARTGIVASERCDSGLQRFAIGLAEVSAALAEGHFDSAERICARYAEMSAGEVQARSIVDTMRGQTLLARGALAEAVDRFERALAAMATALTASWTMVVAAWCAQAEGARGNADLAQAALSEAETVYGSHVAVFRPELELARAWVFAARGEITTARAHALSAARVAQQTAAWCAEARARYTAVRFGDRGQASRLQELARQIPGELSDLMAYGARALAEHDGGRLDEVADGFAEIGAIALAADAASQAVGEHARGGAVACGAASLITARRFAELSGAMTPSISAADKPLPLTDREREVAVLVAGGMSNREVSDALHLSVRTIENYLYRVYAKLGVQDRDGLAQIFSIASNVE
ncbi:LuxR C-terminal-related transcriptional regulator [Nocardia fluminea]|uniref:LuxR C-terminal-related transcriptional regulator n=1 Tax=Nocardia fluminea TaxID=134984 RepID=UPI003656D368